MKRNKTVKRKSQKQRIKLFKLTVLGLVLINLFLSILSLNYDKDSLKELAASETTHFIAKVAKSAHVIAREKDLYPSVMLAQAILESNNGKSTLSQEPYYNFFGIKGDYQGKSVIFPTLEDDGQGNLHKIDAKFRSYGKAEASFRDYARVLEDPLYIKTHVSKSKSYQESTETLRGTYATDSSYNQKLNELIESFKLYNFDYRV
ncbi:glycoside hydrolase family 73 protein [Streptococcus catagoni]|uniref:glycoside hydrolase family 73 protein n=1 Tax=Streptococcus catagoni TaxID=2654874 RepID=UPI00140CC581|nr:glycoside hydrolase family 73 protein [Streptococcus catagoni]